MSGSSESLSSQSEYHEAQSSSAPSTIRNTTWWVSPASWSTSATRRTLFVIVTPVHAVASPSLRARGPSSVRHAQGGRQLGPAVHAELRVDPVEVVLHGPGGDD